METTSTAELSFFEQMARTLEFNPEAALKFSGGVRAFIMSASTIADIFDDFYLVLGERFVNARTYMGGRRAGLRTGEALVAKFQLDPNDKLKIETFFSDFYAAIGWAKLTFHLDYATRSGYVIATNSFLAQGALAKFTARSTATAVDSGALQNRCTMLAGYAAGLVSFLFASDVDAQETECLATHQPACRFEILGERIHASKN